MVFSIGSSADQLNDFKRKNPFRHGHALHQSHSSIGPEISNPSVNGRTKFLQTVSLANYDPGNPDKAHLFPITENVDQYPKSTLHIKARLKQNEVEGLDS